jgi:hypothetical protein
MLSYSSIVNNGRVTLPSVDSWGGNLNIMRDPPKSVQTRRIDKVGDNNEITKMIDDSDRSSEAILRFARGVNPMVGVSFQNAGSSTQGFNNQQARLPYTINKDGDFHVPVRAPQDLLALSRLPRSVTSANSNPGLPHNLKELDNSRNTGSINSTVKPIVISSAVKSTKTYYLQKPFQEAFEHSKNGIQNILHKNAQTNSNQHRQTELFVQDPRKGINENYNTVSAEPNKQDIRFINLDSEGYDSKSIQDSNNVNVVSNPSLHVDNGLLLGGDMIDLTNMKLKDVSIIEYETPLSGPGKTEHIYENFELLDRNLPEYSSFSNRNGATTKINFIHDDIELERNLPEYDVTSNNRGFSKDNNYIHNDISLERNLPEYQTRTNTQGVRRNVNYLHKDLELEKNLPHYQTKTNIVGGAKVSFIHNERELERNLPEYQSNTNITYNTQKYLDPEYVRENERKVMPTNFYTNENKQGENNISAREYMLEDKLQYGGFSNGGSIPIFGRNTQDIRAFESDKSKMSKTVMNQFIDRYSS